MLKIRGPLSLTVPSDILSARRLICTVASSRDVATFLKELVLTLPEEEHFEFVAGDYVILEAPPYRLAFQDFVLEPAHREEWQHLNLLSLKSELDARTTRAYSLASEPQRHDQIALVVRIAMPPAHSAPDTPPGRVSSYIFGLKPGDTVEIAGPYGDFHVRETDKEIVLIGGGAGIAPLRSIVLDQLARGTRRKMSLWYGARDLRDLCYRVELEAAATTHENFEYHVALSQLREGEAWTGPTGFIHAVVYERYLSTHPAPEDCEYYLCGPPLMSAAVIHMLDELGVDADNIFYDDFGS
jgi:Na+-transporting NADH:ubiquinone oxidoreductase subunit F